MKTAYKFILAVLLAIPLVFLALGAGSLTASAKTVCEGSECYNVSCSTKYDCGQNDFYGFQTCQGNSIYQNYREYTCHNPGTRDSYCTNTYTPKLQRTCDGQGQICKDGYCAMAPASTTTTTTSTNTATTYTAPKPATTTSSTPSTSSFKPQTYIKNYRTACYSNHIYWYDSQENIQEVYKNCSDQNSCTLDACRDNGCKNTLKCDGTTCDSNSEDYAKYCAAAQTQTQEQATQVQNQSAPVQSQNLGVMLLVKKESERDYKDNASFANNERIQFLLRVSNTSVVTVDNVSVKVEFPAEVEYAGNLKVDNVENASDIKTALALGSLMPGASKEINFYGTAKSESEKTEVKITATATSGNVYNTSVATVSVSPAPSAVKNNFAAALGSSSLALFVKKWFLWIIVTAVLLALFIIIFRRLSMEV